MLKIICDTYLEMCTCNGRFRGYKGQGSMFLEQDFARLLQHRQWIHSREPDRSPLHVLCTVRPN